VAALLDADVDAAQPWLASAYVAGPSLSDHIARLRRTAGQFGVPFDPVAIETALTAITVPEPVRVRLTLAADGAVAVSAGPLTPGPEVWALRLADDRLESGDPWLRVKTSMRARYDSARAALPSSVDEWVYMNERGEVCEGTITNLFVRVDGMLLTPPVGSGLLPGVLRGCLIRQGRAREAVLGPRDLERGDVMVGNSLRGLRPARLDR